MGLFGSKKKKVNKVNNHLSEDPKELLSKFDPEFRKREKALDYQNELLSWVNAARDKYKADKDLESAIKDVWKGLW